ncbi:alpha/beta hydrolase fold domain-containing protein [Schleiferilactobacillus harbinensis]|jgi:acetyl esterase/lipase|uniref:Alpha/beta hydrolase n=2 Tax=Schleiferilactobacillus harbinensis TaxID=304207 RepID=A0ABU7SXS1_9LACO|nr:alpha/beta hydrolase [Schleiferilactobacillus harbinensis]KRM27957.1 lipase [Schleiferilactobacillus harbinensis DSM 16991]MCT2908836.1 alpha/beta hydrolase [Schleiferilactobacillus harbinensis]QFR63715.1 alpha/beta hydrolase fold domain-containing protein [Schleiferilactobacillus harbinensis]
MKKVLRILQGVGKWIGFVLLAFITGIVISFNTSPKLFASIIAQMPQLAKVGPSPKGWDQYERQVDRHSNIVYPSKYTNNTLDLYTPKKNQGKQPVIFWLHGGAFVSGSKEGVRDWAYKMTATQGYNVVAVNYEVAPNAQYPDQIIQLGEAIHYFQTHQADYPQLDMNKIIIGGDSAGAQMASQYIAVQTNPALAKDMNLTPQLQPKQIIAAVLYCGPYDMKTLATIQNKALQFMVNQLGWAYMGSRDWVNSDMARQSSTTDQVTADYPPTFLTDGNTGSFEGHAQKLASVLKANDVPVSTLFFGPDQAVYHEYQFTLRSKNARLAFDRTTEFLNQYR